MSVLRRMLTLAAAGLSGLVVGTCAAPDATGQPMLPPQMAPQYSNYYQPNGQQPGMMQPADQDEGDEAPGDNQGYSGGGGGVKSAGDEPLEVGSFLDSAIPVTQVRVRFDHMVNFEKFDRAEYFFPTTVANGGKLPAPETVLDLQELTTTLEVAVTDRFSMFVDLPAEFVDSDSGPQANGGQNRDGFGDMRAGGKFALLACDRHFLTVEGRVYMPTGNATEGLGVGHTSVEGGLLYWGRLGKRITLEGEVLDWVDTNSPTIPNQSLFGGNVLQYGAGAGFDVINKSDDFVPRKVSVVAEFKGWTVLDGCESTPQGGVTNARGETIVNAFYGVRGTYGQQSFYAGYGRRLTGDYWYKEVFRLEYDWRY